MNGISNDNFSVEMPILTSFGGMTQYVTILRTAFSFFGVLFADGGRNARAIGELQSAAVGRRRTARLKEPQYYFSYVTFCSDKR